MRPQDRAQAEELFHQALPLDPDGRATLLAEISTEHPDLAKEVKSLLAAHDTEGVLDRLTPEIATEPFGPGRSAHDSTDGLKGTSIGHYEVGELIGRGGMGDVYQARDSRLGRDVALKFLPVWLSRDPSARDRFLVEARVVSSIDHPNVCTLLEMGDTDEGHMFLVMPFYEGETLNLVLESGPLSVDKAVDIALQTARGLSAAHERGIVHRDIKPANLLITREGRVKILDFGIAKLVDVSLTRPDQQPGTARYMSPEQAAGRPVDARSDLWSLGLVLFEMLTGERPAAVADQSGLSSALSEVPMGLAGVIRRLLSLSPDDRYPDAHSLAQDLTILASGSGGLAAHPAPFAKRILAELKRRQVLRVAAVYGVAGFVVIQAVDFLFPRIPLPLWTINFVVWLLLLGFPVALVLAWAFQMTPDGVRRTADAAPGELMQIVAAPAVGRWTVGLAAAGGTALFLIGVWVVFGRSGPGDAGTDAAAGSNPTAASIAVLPFSNLSGDEETQPFVDGVHDDLLIQLSKVSALTVISRTSVLEYRNTTKNLRDIAGELGVATVLEGGVQRMGNRYRINVQLIDAETDAHLWAEQYSGELTVANIFDVQTLIALSITEELESTLTAAERENLDRLPTEDLQAYQIYQAAREFRWTNEESGLRAGDRMASQAIERDSLFAEAYALKAVFASMLFWFHHDRSDSIAAAARDLSARALELAPDLPEGHWARGHYFYRIHLDYDRSLEEVELALRGRPGEADYEALAGDILRRKGDMRAALERYLRTAVLAPRTADVAHSVAETYGLMREYEAAEQWLLRSNALDPERALVYHTLARMRIQGAGDIAGARSWLGRAVEMDVYDHDQYLNLAQLEMIARNPGAAIQATESWEDGAYSSQFQYWPAALTVGLARRLEGDSAAARLAFGSARLTLEELIAHDPTEPRYRGALGIALAGLGHAEAAIREGEEGVRLMPPEREAWRGTWRAYELARIYAMTGETEQAIDWLERLLAMPSDVSVSTLRLNPAWDPLRQHPRFEALVGGT